MSLYPSVCLMVSPSVSVQHCLNDPWVDLLVRYCWYPCGFGTLAPGGRVCTARAQRKHSAHMAGRNWGVLLQLAIILPMQTILHPHSVGQLDVSSYKCITRLIVTGTGHHYEVGQGPVQTLCTACAQRANSALASLLVFFVRIILAHSIQNERKFLRIFGLDFRFTCSPPPSPLLSTMPHPSPMHSTSQSALPHSFAAHTLCRGWGGGGL